MPVSIMPKRMLFDICRGLTEANGSTQTAQNTIAFVASSIGQLGAAMHMLSTFGWTWRATQKAT